MKKIVKLSAAFMGMGIPAYFLARFQQGCIDRWKEQADRNQELYWVLDQWLKICQDGRRLEEYFIKNKYQNIAIYGMECLGQHLVKELRDSGIKIAYVIDNMDNDLYLDITRVTEKDELVKVDAVVITTLVGFDAVCDVLSQKLDCPMIAIEDILNEI